MQSVQTNAAPKSDNDTLEPAKARVEKSPCGKFEFLHPTSVLSAKVKRITSRGTDPTAAAEHHISNLGFEFADWIADMRGRLRSAWQQYKQNPCVKANRAHLNAAIHLIKGNAPTIGYVNAGDIAGSLSKLLERARDWSGMEKSLGLCISAILAAMSEKGKTDNPIHLDILNAIAVLVERKLAKIQPALGPHNAAGAS